MKKEIILFTCCFFLVLHQSVACTTFFINKNGQLVFGRNYDWITGAGMVCSNLKGLVKTSMKVPDGRTISWVSRYGSITFNQYGKEFPTGGMNEAGLVVEIMWADGTQYPAPDKRPAVGVLQWVQYQLDNNSSVEEVLATDKIIRLSSNNPPLHYLVADANGNAATIEFFDGKTIIHTGKDLPFPVLTNNFYSESAKSAVDANVLTGNTSFSFQDNSLFRFAKTCSMLQSYQQNKINKPAVDYAFDILGNVAVKDFTKWSIVYDLKNRKVYFQTASYPDIKSFNYESFDFNCSGISVVVNMNQSFKGDINKYFIPYNSDLNRTVVEKAVSESKSQVNISDKDKESNLSYPSGIACKSN
jgi:penicillin V acylase-like amidase (Ntn superfamily)